MRPTSCALVLSSMVAVQRCRKPKPARKDRNACHSGSLLAPTDKGSVHVWCQRGAVGDNLIEKGSLQNISNFGKRLARQFLKAAYILGLKMTLSSVSAHPQTSFRSI